MSEKITIEDFSCACDFCYENNIPQAYKAIMYIYRCSYDFKDKQMMIDIVNDFFTISKNDICRQGCYIYTLYNIVGGLPRDLATLLIKKADDLAQELKTNAGLNEINKQQTNQQKAQKYIEMLK